MFENKLKPFLVHQCGFSRLEEKKIIIFEDTKASFYPVSGDQSHSASFSQLREQGDLQETLGESEIVTHLAKNGF